MFSLWHYQKAAVRYLCSKGPHSLLYPSPKCWSSGGGRAHRSCRSATTLQQSSRTCPGQREQQTPFAMSRSWHSLELFSLHCVPRQDLLPRPAARHHHSLTFSVRGRLAEVILLIWLVLRMSSSSCCNCNRPSSTSSTCRELGLANVSLSHLVAQVTWTCSVDPQV